MDLLERQKVRILDKCSTNYSLHFNPRGGLLTPTLDKYIIEWRDKKGKPFLLQHVIPQMVGVLSYSLDSPPSHRCVISCAAVSWAQYSMLNKSGIWEATPQAEHFYTLGADCLLQTSDDLFILTFRSELVSHCPNMWAVSSAGYVDLAEALRAKSAMPVILREIKEELGLEPSDICDLKEVALCEHTTGLAVRVICFSGKTNLTSREVLKRAENAEDAWEGKHGFFTADELRCMLEQKEFVPSGAATIAVTLDFL
ncbi:MAG: hypothetical protein HYT98_01325 [Candidatus Sungbacteria bacterium]|nr:hypothetical protein [Candidatus Sungbacteria bacterium]